MRYTFLFALLAATLAMLASPVQAQSALEKEHQQLLEKRDKALAAAEEPIHRRYKDGLEMLLRRATLGNDLEIALKIKKELENPTPAASPAQAINGSVWKNSRDGATITFHADGKAKGSWGRVMTWHYPGQDKLMITFDREESWMLDTARQSMTNPAGIKWNRLP